MGSQRASWAAVVEGERGTWSETINYLSNQTLSLRVIVDVQTAGRI